MSDKRFRPPSKSPILHEIAEEFARSQFRPFLKFFRKS